jgi:uncharacterized phage protein gp47/JayE
MIDPGHPFVRQYQDLIAALETSIRYGVEQPDRFQETFKSAVTTYPLPRIATAITQVSGTIGGGFTLFRENIDYRFGNNRLSWLSSADPDNPARHPDEGSRFEVAFTYRLRPAGLTDFNEGSVIGTLVRAVAREITLIYGQVDEAYRRAFIDQATGVALDNVVALLGITRNPARTAAGQVTFARKQPAGKAVVIEAQTRVADAGGKTFVTTAAGTIRTGETDVTVPIEAVTAGPQGNVDAATIVIMPTPPRGVDGVTNALPTAGGHDPEPDDQLRERARHALETAGKATLNALRFAILDVDGVEAVEVVDHQADSSIAPGEVRVLFSGRDTEDVRNKVQETIDRTRAAGVLVNARMIETVLISGTFYVIATRTPPVTDLAAFKAAIIAALERLGIGEALSVRRLNAAVYAVPGLAEVAEAQLISSKKPPDNPEGEVSDPYLIERTELLRPDAAHLEVLLLAALAAADAGGSGLPHDVDLQLLDSEARAIRFNHFSLDIDLTLKARSITAPDQPAERIGGVQRRIEFVGQSIFRLTLAKAHLSIPDELLVDFDLSQVNVTISAAAFEGLQPATDLTVDISS